MASTDVSPVVDLSPAQRFFRYFQLEATALQDQMARLEQLSSVGGERMDAIDHCLGGISRLQKEVQDAHAYTTAYDQKMYSEAIKALHHKLDVTRAALAPKAKFTFKSIKKNNSAISLNDAAELAMQQHAKLFKHNQHSLEEPSLAPTPLRASTPTDEASRTLDRPLRKDSLGSFLEAAGVDSASRIDQSSAAIHKISPNSSKEINVKSHTGVHVVLPSSASHATSSGSLTDLHRCIVDMSVPMTCMEPFPSLTIKDVDASLLLCGNVRGSAHVTNVESSIILVNAQQFRMHDCRNCIVYLYVASDPIIENCSGIQFARLPKAFSEPDESNITSSANRFDKVQDFKWLRSEPSPNWSVLPDSGVVTEEVWEKITESRHVWNLDDILKLSGVAKLASS